MISKEYHDRPLVQFAVYGIAGAVSVARFTGQKHYLSDVLVGSAMGYGIGRYVYHAHHLKNSTEESESRRPSRKWPLIAPQYNRHQREYGATVAWNF